MLCSARELGISEDGEGLLLLDRQWALGTPLGQIFPDGDDIFEVSVTANRGDCMGHLGIARELSAHFRIPLECDPYKSGTPTFPCDEEKFFLLKKLFLESDLCHRFLAWSIHGIRVGPSPAWLRRDLERLGMRSINNVVDVTNWTMLDCGQPLHAFDAAKIRGGNLHIRRAGERESLVALNHRTYSLTPEMLVLSDEERPLVIAGVMGSVDAEVDESTVDIVLECACFSSASIQGTARELGLHSDASQRFARGTDPFAMEFCIRRAVAMVLDLCGGRASCRPQVVGEEIEKDSKPIFLRRDFLEKICGATVDGETLEDALRRLHFTVERQPEGWMVEVPPFRRNDVRLPIDLLEEFVRVHGLGKL
jgi:phenylalanyl-tRNA synthetase beta chain